MALHQHIVDISDLVPGDTYSYELGGKTYTVAKVEPRDEPDYFGQAYRQITNEDGSIVLRRDTDHAWRNN